MDATPISPDRAETDKSNETHYSDFPEIDKDGLKGKLDLQWFGHGGFKLSFRDQDSILRQIYIDIWIDNKDCPKEVAEECPTDCDLALVTQGRIDHSLHSIFLIKGGDKPNRKIVCS